MAQKKAKKKSTQSAPKKATAAQAVKSTAKAAKKGAQKTVKKAAPSKAKPAKVKAVKKEVTPKAPVAAKTKSAPKAGVIAATGTASKAKPVPKQTKKEALKAAGPAEMQQAVLEEQNEKEITKAKKALGKAKQSLAKARMKDFGSKLGKNLANQGVEELAKKWDSLFKKADAIESKPYRMKDSFEERTAIEHKVLGWGFVLSNQNDRLEVLFRDGIRYLISNYKP